MLTIFREHYNTTIVNTSQEQVVHKSTSPQTAANDI